MDDQSKTPAPDERALGTAIQTDPRICVPTLRSFYLETGFCAAMNQMPKAIRAIGVRNAWGVARP